MPRPPKMFDGSSSSVSKIINRKRFHFFKIILPATIQQQRLGLPKKFVRKFGKELSEVAILTVPNGKKWHVELKQIEDEIWLGNGWQEFVNYYSIGVGHFLVFGYDVSSCFHVLIFDTSATEIEYPCHVMDLEESNQGNECQAPSKESESVESLGTSTPGPIRAESVKEVSNESVRHQTSTMGHLKRKGKCEAPSMEGSDSVEIVNVSPKRHVKSSSKRDRKSTKNVEACFTGTQSTESDGCYSALQEESSDRLPSSRNSSLPMFSGRWPVTSLMSRVARDFKSDNPFYLVIMRSSFVNHPFTLNVPSDFARKYIKHDLFLTLRVSDGRSWRVRCHSIEYGAKISGGWRYFVKQNLLKEGDVCIFELINSDSMEEMKVVIYRAST